MVGMPPGAAAAVVVAVVAVVASSDMVSATSSPCPASHPGLDLLSVRGPLSEKSSASPAIIIGT